MSDESGRVEARVRAHHLLCLLAFSGAGYSARFVREFARLAKLYARPGVLLQVVASPDDACKACPYLETDGCHSEADGPEANVAVLDGAVLSALKIVPGVHESSALSAAVRSLPRDVLDSLCARCSWFGKTDCQDRILGR